jgi:cobaltochelatase CobN
LFDLLHDAYVADAAVRDFLLRENPQAAAAIADRLEAARQRGFWHPRRNDVEATLAALRYDPIPHVGEKKGRGRDPVR